MHLANEHRKESELSQQTKINQPEMECMTVDHNDDSGEEKLVDFLDAATEPINHVLDFF